MGTNRACDFANLADESQMLRYCRICRALEAAGVEFIDENGGGPGVRLRKRTSKGSTFCLSNIPCDDIGAVLQGKDVAAAGVGQIVVFIGHLFPKTVVEHAM